MKNRFKVFIFTYFYFTPQERKGIFSLFVLLVLLQVFVWTYPFWATANVNNYQSIPFELLKDSLENQSLEKPNTTNKPDSFVQFPPYKQFYSVRTERKDSFVAKNKGGLRKVIELNTCDSEALVSLPKIGPYMAHKILVYRKQLGGFYSLNQLTEIYGFNEDWLFDLETKWQLNPDARIKFDLNQVELNDLKTHPYFKYTLSRAIIQYRQQHGPFVTLADLRKMKMVNDSIYNLILPYCDLK